MVLFSHFALFIPNAECISDSPASLHSHCLRSRRVLRRQLGPVNQGPIFPTKPAWVQVHFRVQGPDGRLHQRVPCHEDNPAQAERWHTTPIRQRHRQHHKTDNVCHLQWHPGVSGVSHHLSENRPMSCVDSSTHFLFWLFSVWWGEKKRCRQFKTIIPVVCSLPCLFVYFWKSYHRLSTLIQTVELVDSP